MITPNQLLRSSTKRVRTKKKTNPIFQGCPQVKGICLSVECRSPNKPNSAERKVANVMLSNGKKIVAYIPGIKHDVQQHAQLLIRGGSRADLPVVKGFVIRGKLGAGKVKDRKTSRSKY